MWDSLAKQVSGPRFFGLWPRYTKLHLMSDLLRVLSDWIEIPSVTGEEKGFGDALCKMFSWIVVPGRRPPLGACVCGGVTEFQFLRIIGERGLAS
jgi:hypothetical protein